MAVLKFKDGQGVWHSIPAIKGEMGASAYEQAQTAGYTGTLEDFYADLVAIEAVDSKMALVDEAVLKADEAALKADAMASGSPKGRYATLVALQEAWPTGDTGAYLVQADSHLYFWDTVTSAWVDGGLYNVAAASQVEITDTSGYFASDNIEGALSEIGYTIKRTTGVVNVKEYGAIGDGVADDTDAINAAIAATTAGQTLFFPKAEYVVSDEFTLLVPMIVEGRNAVIITTETVVFNFTELDGVKFSGLTLVGPGGTVASSPTTDGAITGTYSDHVIVKDCDISEFCTGISITYSDNVRLENNHVYNYLAYGLMLSKTNNFIVTKNTVHDSLATGVTNTYCLSATGNATRRQNNSIISENIFYNNAAWSAFMSHGVEKLIISNNHIYNCRNGIDLTNDDYTIANVVIEGNYIEGTGTDAYDGVNGMNNGIALIASGDADITDILIRGNIVKGFSRFNSGAQANAQIQLQSVSNAVITGNNLYTHTGVNAIRTSIWISGESSRVVVNGNIIVSYNTAGVSLSGITGDGIIVTSNVMSIASGITGVVLSGSTINGLKIKDNLVSGGGTTYREVGTNVIDGKSLVYPDGGFGEERYRTYMFSVDAVTDLTPGELRSIATFSVPPPTVSQSDILMANYSKAGATGQIVVRAVRWDSGNIRIFIKNEGASNFSAEAGNVQMTVLSVG